MILNLKSLNEKMPYIHFKMETIKLILILVTPNCYMAKVDIKDAYYSIPILPEHHKYVKSILEENFINLRAFQMIFAQFHAGQFTKTPSFLSKFTASYCNRVYWWFNYNGQKFFDCERNIKLIETLLDSLGFVVHPDKSIFVPARLIEYLGFAIDFQSMTIFLKGKKKASIKQLCHEVLQE